MYGQKIQVPNECFVALVSMGLCDFRVQFHDSGEAWESPETLCRMCGLLMCSFAEMIIITIHNTRGNSKQNGRIQDKKWQQGYTI
jgi:hypothetical protein